MPVNIKGREYYTVAERLEQASKVIKSIKTEVLYLEPSIMVKATVETDKGTFTGISAANPDKRIEAIAPVEVAETSAVGRALAFAGYAGSEIASADEMNKAMTQPTRKTVDKRVEKYNTGKPDGAQKQLLEKPCKKCGAKMVMSSKGNVICSDFCWTK